MISSKDLEITARLIGIYNADASTLGEARYALGKVAGNSSCELCDITHGWNPFGKKSWKRACNSTSMDLELIHRNEATPSQLQAAKPLPAFITEHSGQWKSLMSKDEITQFKNRPEDLIDELSQRLESSQT
jgi:hypothetical protein|tara:strand:+ start:290 stop:682 length:393 start_codon:yes stop_codon:yes gene_type:complete